MVVNPGTCKVGMGRVGSSSLGHKMNSRLAAMHENVSQKRKKKVKTDKRKLGSTYASKSSEGALNSLTSGLQRKK